MRALVLVAGLALLGGCTHLDEVDLTRSGTATVPAGEGAIPVDVAADLGLALGRDALRDADVDPGNVDSARVRVARVEVVSGADLETWLERVAFYVEGGGRPRTLVAERTGIGALGPGTTTVELATTGVDLTPYVTAEDGRLTVEVEGTLPDVETVVRGTVTVRVDVDVSSFLGL